MEAPIFVKIEDYKNITSLIESIKSKIDEARNLLIKVNELKGKEEMEIGICSNNLEEVERKIEHIKTLLGEEARL